MRLRALRSILASVLFISAKFGADGAEQADPSTSNLYGVSIGATGILLSPDVGSDPKKYQLSLIQSLLTHEELREVVFAIYPVLYDDRPSVVAIVDSRRATEVIRVVKSQDFRTIVKLGPPEELLKGRLKVLRKRESESRKVELQTTIESLLQKGLNANHPRVTALKMSVFELEEELAELNGERETK